MAWLKVLWLRDEFLIFLPSVVNLWVRIGDVVLGKPVVAVVGLCGGWRGVSKRTVREQRCPRTTPVVNPWGGTCDVAGLETWRFVVVGPLRRW